MNHGAEEAVDWRRRAAAWLVHLFTATGAVLGLFALYAIGRGKFLQAFWFMAGTVLIDSMDGAMARRADVKVVLPGFDGALLDNMVDYFTYVTVPAFFLINGDIAPEGWKGVAAAGIVLASAYQFAQTDAKTEDNFFKGFPSYWNFVVFYLFLWQMGRWVNLAVLFALIAMVFIPIKYVYPSRMNHLTRRIGLRRAMFWATIAYGAATAVLLWLYPRTDRFLVGFSVAYIVCYFLVSVYRTLVPLRT